MAHRLKLSRKKTPLSPPLRLEVLRPRCRYRPALIAVRATMITRVPRKRPTVNPATWPPRLGQESNPCLRSLTGASQPTTTFAILSRSPLLELQLPMSWSTPRSGIDAVVLRPALSRLLRAINRNTVRLFLSPNGRSHSLPISRSNFSPSRSPTLRRRTALNRARSKLHAMLSNR
ncbi:hypothetical protein F5X98DRAFT_386677 [Xylaria grammica]|nr:hypothetical protein F5X98DRAFT_386677 [Xylaria grammica]